MTDFQSDLFQLAIIAVILLGIFIAWRAGQANPESTGRLARRISKVESELNGKATTKDVARVSSKVDALAAQIEGDRRLNERTYDAVRRIEDYLRGQGGGR